MIASHAIGDDSSMSLVGKWIPDGKSPNGDKVVAEFKADGTWEEIEEHPSGQKSKLSGTWGRQSESKAVLTQSNGKKAEITLTDKQTLELLPTGKKKPIVYKRMP